MAFGTYAGPAISRTRSTSACQLDPDSDTFRTDYNTSPLFGTLDGAFVLERSRLFATAHVGNCHNKSCRWHGVTLRNR